VLRRWRRRRTLARYAIPDALWQDTLADVPSLSRLDTTTLTRLRDLALLFAHEKAIEAGGDLILDDAMRVRIAALACRPILDLGLDSYSDVYSIVVHPAEFVVPNREYIDDAGVVHLGDDVLSGEAWEQGPVVLAWEDVLASGRGDGYDVVAHEFAHKLDLLGGAMDGMPPLHTDMTSEAWVAAFQRAYDDLRARLKRGEDPWLDAYAAEDPAEFFAVSSEMFFDLPERLRDEYPDVYAQLAAFYRQSPAAEAERSP
jgi:Mlc titration factor MtfA (ptsG expression regulator)